MSMGINRPALGPDGRLRVTIIGPLTVRRGDITIVARELGGPKPRQILEILLLHLGVPVSKDRLIDLLWGTSPPREALATLESYVSVLRRRLQPDRGTAGALRTSNRGYVMDADLVDLDLARFHSLVHEAAHVGAAEALPILVEALALSSGPLLGDELGSEWAEEERVRHAVVVTRTQVLAAESAVVRGDQDSAIEWASRVLAGDPMNERAWTALVVAYEGAGRHAEGLRAYDQCRQQFARELGCAPGAALREAHARLLQATAADPGELSEVVSALLILDAHLSGKGSRRPPRGDVVTDHDYVRDAGELLASYVRRVLAVA